MEGKGDWECWELIGARVCVGRCIGFVCGCDGLVGGVAQGHRKKSLLVGPSAGLVPDCCILAAGGLDLKKNAGVSTAFLLSPSTWKKKTYGSIPAFPIDLKKKGMGRSKCLPSSWDATRSGFDWMRSLAKGGGGSLSKPGPKRSNRRVGASNPVAEVPSLDESEAGDTTKTTMMCAHRGAAG